MQQTNSSETCPDKGQPNKKHSDQIIATTNWITVPVWIFFLVGGTLAFVAHYYVNERSVRIKFFTDAMLAASVGIIAVIQTIFYYRQTKTLDIQEGIFREQSQLMKDALVISNRAYVGVHSIEAEWDAERIAITIENTGHVPADDVKATVELRTMIPKGWLQPNEEELNVKRIENDFGHTKLFAGNLKIKLYAHLNRVPKQYHPLFVQGHALIVIRCWITYGDGFGNTETTEFAFNYFRDASTKESEGRWYTFPIKTAEEWARLVTTKTHPPEVIIRPASSEEIEKEEKTEPKSEDEGENPN